MRHIIFSWFVLFSGAIAFADGAPTVHQVSKIPDKIQAQLKDQWGTKKISAIEKAAFFFPHLIEHPIEFVLFGKTAHRVIDLGSATIDLIGGIQKPALLEQAGYKSADSILNPGGDFNDVFSDIASVVKSPEFVNARFSKRIQVCTSNLMSGLSGDLTPYHQIMPAEHVALMIDGGVLETRDPLSSDDLHEALDKGGIACVNIPVMAPESDSLAIEKITCIDSEYRQHFSYDFIRNNCGTYTREITKLAGLGFPIVPNAGVGYFNAENNAEKREYMKAAQLRCETHVDMLRHLFEDLELGHDLTPVETKFLADIPNLSISSDAALQIFVSAARGKNEANRLDVVKLHDSVVLNSYLTDGASSTASIKKSASGMLAKMLRGLDNEAKQWLQTSCPQTAKIIQSLTGQ